MSHKLRGDWHQAARFAKLNYMLFKSCPAGRGIRILRQDTFETLVSFQISQRKSIHVIQTAIDRLCRVYGFPIGEVEGRTIFGFHRLDAFPIDVWMKRALSDHYPSGYDSDRYRPFNGVMQQYMFAYYKAGGR